MEVYVWCMRTHTRSQPRTHACAHTHTHTHAHTHTHTHTLYSWIPRPNQGSLQIPCVHHQMSRKQHRFGLQRDSPTQDGKTIVTEMYSVSSEWCTCSQISLIFSSWALQIQYNETPYKGHHWDPAGCPVWNLSIEDTIGTQLAVLFREVSLIQRQICTQLYVFGTAHNALIREMSLIQSALYREVPLYYRVKVGKVAALTLAHFERLDLLSNGCYGHLSIFWIWCGN